MNILIVGGTFDENGGKRSGYLDKVVKGMDPVPGWFITFRNGGTLQQLDMSFYFASGNAADVVLWFPNVSNDVTNKMVRDIKVSNPKALLIISKNNRDGKYTYMDLLGRMFQAHAAYSLIFDPCEDMFEVTILDPLGNSYVQHETNPQIVGYTLNYLIYHHQGLTRIGSKCVDSVGSNGSDPELDEFCGLVRGYADTFHELVHGVNTARFLGNVSYRCTKGGFPSYRGSDGLIYVSKRNIDKRELSCDNFVPVELNNHNPVEYYGEAKPSVDTPIQLRLYQALPKVNFMLHSHCYIENAPFTQHAMPCGAIEEVEEILTCRGYGEATKFNLLGHGSIVLAYSLADLKNIKYMARPFPERFNPHLSTNGAGCISFQRLTIPKPLAV